MRATSRVIAAAALVAAAAARWLGWRYATLGREVAARQYAIAAALEPCPGDEGRDASSRIALAVEANEARFEEMVALGESQRVAGVLTLVLAGAALVLGTWAWRHRRSPAREPGGTNL